MTFIFVSHLLCRCGARYFRGFAGFFAEVFVEKWNYLPTAPGKDCRVRKFLPGGAGDREIPAGQNFPPMRKIDV
jgi:hypothetical protein